MNETRRAVHTARCPVAARIRAPGMVLAALFAGCQESPSGPAISVALSPATSSVSAGGTQDFTATIASDANNGGVTWKVTGAGCSAAACGTLSATTSPSGTAVTFIAPATVPSPATVTVTAASATSSARISTATVTITAPPIAVIVSPGISDVQAGAHLPLSATVANDASNAGVTWTLSGSGCTGATCGTLSAAASASGTTVTYTAPAAKPSPAAVTITATSVADNTKLGAATLTITPPIGVTVSPSSGNVQASAHLALSATVINDASNAGVSWTLSGSGCTGAACGTLSSAASASGATVTYTAPAAKPSPADVTITATSVANNTKLGAAKLTITPPISVSVSPSSGNVRVSAHLPFTATVAYDASNAGVIWTLSGSGCTAAACGTLSSAASASGAVVTYTAPPAKPSPADVTLTATAVGDNTKLAAATITITPPPPPLASCLNDPPTTDPGCDLTDYPGPHDFFLFPAISGSRVVWIYDKLTLSAHLAVMMYDLSTDELREVTPPSTQNYQTAIDGDRIVYARLNTATAMFEFYYYDIPSRTETLFWTVDDTLNFGRFALSGDHAVISMNRNNNWDIYLYDIVKKTETRLTTDPSDQGDPSISGNIVTWSDKRAGQLWWDLYMYDLSTQQTTRITQSPTLGRSAIVTPDHIVWGDVRGGFFTLYEYSFATRQERMINTSLLENNLTAAGPYVAWVNRNDANPVFYDDIFIYDFSTGTERRLTQLAARQWMPAVSDKYIAWEDDREAGPNIFVSRMSDVFP